MNETSLLQFKLPDLAFRCTDSTEILVGIASRPTDIADRHFIRKTWGSDKGKNTAVIFLLGFHEVNFVQCMGIGRGKKVGEDRGRTGDKQ